MISYNNFENVSKMYFYDASAGTYTERSGATMDYFADDAAIGDILYFGLTPGDGFRSTIKINVGTPLVADDITVVWEYNAGSLWKNLPDIQDTSNVFRNTGVQYLAFKPQPDWYWGTVNGEKKIWIRCRITAITNITEGGANQTTAPQNKDLKLTITGTETLSSILAADKAGTFTLMYPVSAASNLSLFWQPRPMEWGACKLSCVITNYSGAGNITLTGTDGEGNAISEVIAVSANGTLTSTKSYKTIDSGGIDCTGTYTLQINQSRWGVCGKFFDNSYVLDYTVFMIGDGSTETVWTETTGYLKLNYSAIKNTANSTITLGSLGGTTPVETRPFIISHYCLNTSGGYTWQRILDFVYGDVNLYNFTFYNEAGPYHRIAFKNSVIRRATLYYTYEVDFVGTADVSDFEATQGGGGIDLLESSNNLNIKDGKNYGFNKGCFIERRGNTRETSHKLTRLDSKNCTYDVTLYSNGVGIILVDPVFTPVTSKLNGFMSVGVTYNIWLDYTFDLKVIDANNNNISGASVILKDKNGTEIINTTTDANGTIASTEVNAKVWSHTNDTGTKQYIDFVDEDLTDYNDFTLEIKKAGYQTYTKKFTLDKKIDWVIRLGKTLNNNFSKRCRINYY